MRCKANALLEINHCLEQQAYVDWKYQQLADLVRTPPKARAGNGSRVVEDQLRLVRMLKQRWRIDAALNRDKHYYRLRIAVGSVSRFRDIVASHMLEQFAYKFP